AIGFEKMGRFTPYTDRAYPLDRHMAAMASRHEGSDALITAQMFGNAGREHMARYGTRAESFARIAVKNHRHSVHNPRAQFRKEFSLEEVMASPTLYAPLTLLQSCPTSSGAAAAVVASERFVRERGLGARAVEVVGQAMATDFPTTFSAGDIALIGARPTRARSRRAHAHSRPPPRNRGA